MDFDECVNFEMMCDLGAKFANDESPKSLCWLDATTKPHLYEMIGEYAFIRPIIRRYNELGLVLCKLVD